MSEYMYTLYIHNIVTECAWAPKTSMNYWNYACRLSLLYVCNYIVLWHWPIHTENLPATLSQRALRGCKGKKKKKITAA